MRIGHSLAIFSLVLAAPAGVRAQSRGGLEEVESWLRLGPALLPSFSIRGSGKALEPGGVLRFGVLAGLPLQFELTLNLTARVKEPADALAWGVRLIPLSWMPSRGFEMGGRDGHHVGVIAGFSTFGGYAGPVYEFLVTPFIGFVVEYVVTFGGVPRTPDAVQVGLRFQIPVIEVRTAGDANSF